MRITESKLRDIIRQVILENLDNQIGSKEEEIIDDVIGDYFSGNITQTESDSSNISLEGRKLGKEILKQAKEKPNFAEAIGQEFGDPSDLFLITTIITSDLMSGGFMFDEQSAIAAVATSFLLKFYKAFKRTR